MHVTRLQTYTVNAKDLNRLMSVDIDMDKDRVIAESVTLTVPEVGDRCLTILGVLVAVKTPVAGLLSGRAALPRATCEPVIKAVPSSPGEQARSLSVFPLGSTGSVLRISADAVVMSLSPSPPDSMVWIAVPQVWIRC